MESFGRKFVFGGAAKTARFWRYAAAALCGGGPRCGEAKGPGLRPSWELTEACLHCFSRMYADFLSFLSPALSVFTPVT